MSKLPQKTTPCFGSSSKTLISLRSNLRVLSLFLKHVFVQTLIYTPEINQNPKQKVGKMIGFLWQLKTKGIWCASSVVFQLNNDLSTGCEKQSENKITAIVALALRFFEKLLLVVVLAAKFVYTLVVLRGASEIVYLWRAYLTAGFSAISTAAEMLICCMQNLTSRSSGGGPLISRRNSQISGSGTNRSISRKMKMRTEPELKIDQDNNHLLSRYEV